MRDWGRVLLVLTCTTWVASCAASVRATTVPLDGRAPPARLWEEPLDLARRDLYFGPWGEAHAPHPDAVYSFVRPKEGGTNPGVVVEDPAGREWHVKQASSTGRGAEGPPEVTLSRVLSAIGYFQPPVYYLPRFKMQRDGVVSWQPGGRFRPSGKPLRALGSWSWQRNPFVGSRPYQGLLVVLLLFNSTDLKNDNNELYEFTPEDGRRERWYVVRDLGAALGETGILEPRRNDPERFERSRFTLGVANGFVRFDNRGLHQELIRNRVTPDDVEWAVGLLSQLTDDQWEDAFRAGGHPEDVTTRFIVAIRARIVEGRTLATTAVTVSPRK